MALHRPISQIGIVAILLVVLCGYVYCEPPQEQREVFWAIVRAPGKGDQTLYVQERNATGKKTRELTTYSSLPDYVTEIEVAADKCDGR